MLVVLMRDSAPFDGTLLASGVKLAVAKALRNVSGDLVFNEDGTINQSDKWLWGWEKADPSCYARKCQREGRRLGALDLPLTSHRARPVYYKPCSRSRLVW
jgi:hypothetical protein